MRPRDLTRRRAITILAGAAAGLAAGPATPNLDASEYDWRGVAMGADARVLFSGIAEPLARDCAEEMVAEIARLERALSLFRSDSEICRLNHDGSLPEPSGDLRRALGLALDIARLSGGLFDPTVQRLWEVYVDWFAGAPDTGLPPDPVIGAALSAVDWRRVAVAARKIELGAGQRITLNGLGQGYVTDRVCELLKMRGLRSVFVDLGEQRALGPRDDGRAWLIGRKKARPLELTTGALATSEGSGCILGAGGAAHHLFDPRSGRSACNWTRVTVHHASAAVADALSTALYIASPDEVTAIVSKFDGLLVWASDGRGTEWRWASNGSVGARESAGRAI